MAEFWLDKYVNNCHRYGNTDCRVFKLGVQNKEKFAKESTYPKEVFEFWELGVIQKLMLSKNVNNKKYAPKLVFFSEKKLRKSHMITDIQNWLWK